MEIGRAKAIRRLQRELKEDNNLASDGFSREVDYYVSDGVLDEGERADLEAKIGEYVAKKDVGGEIAEIMSLRQKQTEQPTYIAAVHKLIERLETTKQWVDKIHGVRSCDQRYIVNTIRYLKKPLGRVLRWRSEKRNNELNLLLKQLVAGLVAAIRERADFDDKIRI